jgi:hypothetical protein
MSLTIFSSSLNQFCRDYLVVNPSKSPDLSRVGPMLEAERAAIFEQLMLFGKISFKVEGENILVPVLINTFGLHGLESLIEQDAIGFTLWTPVVTYMISDNPGLMPLQFGTHNSPAHSDPQASLELGYKWMTSQLPRRERRGLTKKLLKHYEIPPPELAQGAVGLAVSAYRSGKLATIGFEPTTPIEELVLPQRKLLCGYAAETLEYAFMVQRNMTSYSNYHYFGLLQDSAHKLASGLKIAKDFSELAIIENFPDFKALITQMEEPFRALPKLRATRNAVRFRKWLAAVKSSDVALPISKEYVEAIADAQSFFETKTGRFVKSIGLTSLGLAVGAAAADVAGAVTGAVIAKVLEPAADYSLDLVDEFLLNGLMKGWTPKMFFDDLEKLRRKSSGP